jgi:DnaJ-class molecular chaperone
LLPEATESEIRVAYRRQVRTSHPDLNQHDPEAASRMKRLNVAAKVLLDPALRHSYDRVPRGAKKTPTVKPAPRAWYERREHTGGDDWTEAPTEAEARAWRGSFGNFWSDVRSREARFGLQVQEMVAGLTGRQQLGLTALLFALALALVTMAGLRGPFSGAPQPTSVHIGSVYP